MDDSVKNRQTDRTPTELVQEINQFTDYNPTKENAKTVANILRYLVLNGNEQLLKVAIEKITTNLQWSADVYGECNDPKIRKQILEDINGKRTRKSKGRVKSKLRGKSDKEIEEMFLEVAKKFSENPNENPPPTMANILRDLEIQRRDIRRRELINNMEEITIPYLVKWILNVGISKLSKHISEKTFNMSSKKIKDAIGFTLKKEVLNKLSTYFQGSQRLVFVEHEKEKHPKRWSIACEEQLQDEKDDREIKSDVLDSNVGRTFDKYHIYAMLNLSEKSIQRYIPKLEELIRTYTQNPENVMREMKVDYKAFSSATKQIRNTSFDTNDGKSKGRGRWQQIK